MRIENRSSVAHRYEDRRRKVVYVIPLGQVREVPDEVAAVLLQAHPDKLFNPEDERRTEGGERMAAGHNRMMEAPEPERPRHRRARKKPRSR